jgi:hypothetical protein
MTSRHIRVGDNVQREEVTSHGLFVRLRLANNFRFSPEFQRPSGINDGKLQTSA